MSPWYCIEVTFGPCVTFSAWCLVLTPSLTFKCLANFERLAYVSLHSLQSQQRELSSAMLRVIHSTIHAKTIHKHLHCSTPPRVIISGGCVAKSLRVSCKYNCSLDPVKGSYSKSSCAKLECFSCLFWNVTTLGMTWNCGWVGMRRWGQPFQRTISSL